jgi:hypothetical protein
MVYMDPPYGIKFASNFQPFINQRDVKDREEDLTREPEMIKAYRDTWEKGVHTYLAYLRDRLYLCRELLSERGSIFVQIGDENVHHVRELMQELFGADNHVATMWFRKSGSQTAEILPSAHDCLLWFSRDRSIVKSRPVFVAGRTGAWGTDQDLWLLTGSGEFRRLTRDERLDPTKRPAGRLARHRTIESTSGSQSSRFAFELDGKEFLPKQTGGWSTSLEGMGRLEAAGRLLAIGESLRYVIYEDDFPYVALTTLWDDTMISGFGEPKKYVVQTSADVIARCLLMTTDPGDMVLDPTCGSGTTAYVAEQWGRRWITIDTSRVALALARQRLMTAGFSMYQTTDGGSDPSRNFDYKKVPHVTLKSIAQNPRLDPDKVKGKTKAEIDAIIAASADQETLYDQPEVVKGVTRVSGPFTVEAIPAPILSPDADSPIVGGPQSLVGDPDDAQASISAQNAGTHVSNLVSLLRQDGITFPGSKKKLMVPDLASRAGQFIHAEGHAQGTEQFVAVSFGPQYGPVTVQQVEQAMRQANRAGFDLLVFAGFAFEAAATAAIDEPAEREVKVLWTQIRPDLLMTDERGNSLLKTTVSSQLFTAFGEPDAELAEAEDGWTVSINGVDIYDPMTGAVASAPIEKVAAWFLDTDYDSRTFCICQAFFPQTTAWDKLARALKGTIDLEKLEKYKGHESLPFKPGKHRAVAVKVNGTRAIEAGTLLVMMALNVDPVFAAELAGLCGPHVWKQVRTAVSDRLRSLYAASDASWRKCALAGMLASGSDDFKDIIEPLVSSDDQQVALGTYRRWDEFHVSSLGPGWRDMVGNWNETARVTFVSELLHDRNVPEVAALALADPSIKVKEAAIQGLSWIGAEDDAAQFLDSLDGPTFDLIVERLAPDLVPEPIRARGIAVLQQCRAKATDPLARLSILLRMFGMGAPKDVDHTKEDLGGITGKIDEQRAYYVIRPALDIVREADAPWTSIWVAEKTAGGFLRHESWHNMITAVPEELKQKLLHRLETEDLRHTHFDNIIAVLAAGADVSMVERTFAKLCELRRTIANAPDQRHEFEWAIERQLETLLRALPASISVAAISSCFSKEADEVELDVITRVFSSVARPDPELRDQIDPNLRERFRAYLKNAVVFVLQQDDFYGELKANVGSVLASVGAPEDMTEMRDLIRADIERVRRGRAARARGDRGQLANGGAMSHSAWHIRAAVKLDPANPDALLLDLLNEPEYERDVATELSRLVAPPAAEDRLFRKVDYGRIWEARAGVQGGPNKERRKRYTAALRRRIEAVLEERSRAQQKRHYDFRLGALGVALAAIDSHGSAGLVFEVMSLPDEWDNYTRVEAFEALLFNGVVLPTDRTLALLDHYLERRRKYGEEQQNEWLLERFLCLLPFVDDPARGIERMRQLISELRLYGYRLREVVEALSHCRCDQALPFLVELGSDKVCMEQLGDAWINAVAIVDIPESRNLLLSFVDPELPGLPDEASLARNDALVARLVELARRDPTVEQRLLRLCDLNLPPAKRSLLAQIVGQLGDVEAVSAGLNLIDDTISTPVPYGILRQLEDAFVERRPHGESQNTYTLEPRSSNAIRAKLLEMATKDERRKKSALRLLGQIEEWRLEYGRPVGEPRHPAFDLGEPWPEMPKA